jgi:hypothetical protein
MRRRILVASFLAAVLACAAAAKASGNPHWIGVWQSKLDGQPGAILTLAQDTGELGGTLVLNRVERDADGQAYVAASEPHTLVNPRIAGDTLTFAVRKPLGPGGFFNFTVALTPEGTARIHCTNCGQDAPVVDLTPAR